MTIRNEPTEDDLLLAELAARGRSAFLGEEGGMTFLIMTADPDAPHDEDAAYGVPHILMYASERADRPAADHRDPWSAHLHVADGTYLTTLVDGSPTPLDAAADAARCAREVTERLSRRHRRNFPPVARRFCTF
ncbi:hypothetical protein [Streptomyces sp. NPDC094049]|uniref:hypothetical protein n=1 Tax=Streptomyces sp. NPDC094049 TaxID=3154987 RepID=UPI00332BC523